MNIQKYSIRFIQFLKESCVNGYREMIEYRLLLSCFKNPLFPGGITKKSLKIYFCICDE